jgi:hypothetical protein
MLTDEDVNEFQVLYKKRFGAEIDHDTAHYKLAMLVRQIELVFKPIRKGQATSVKNENGDDNGREQNSN